MKTQEQTRQIKGLINFASEWMPKLPYHNFGHALSVAHASQVLGTLEGLHYESLFFLETAAYLHDIIYEVGAKDNEERSAKFACDYLPLIGYPKFQAEIIAKLILATKMPWNPRNKLENVLVDADMFNLGTEDFMAATDLVRQEFGVADYGKWYEGTLKLMEGHQYYTPTARMLLNDQKVRNMNTLRLKIRESGMPSVSAA